MEWYDQLKNTFMRYMHAYGMRVWELNQIVKSSERKRFIFVIWQISYNGQCRRTGLLFINIQAWKKEQEKTKEDKKSRRRRNAGQKPQFPKQSSKRWCAYLCIQNVDNTNIWKWNKFNSNANHWHGIGRSAFVAIEFHQIKNVTNTNRPITLLSDEYYFARWFRSKIGVLIVKVWMNHSKMCVEFA